MSDPFVPYMVDLERKEIMTQEVRLKNDQLNDKMMQYLRQMLKQSYFAEVPEEADEILLSRPTDLQFERHCLNYYGQLIDFLKMNLERSFPLEKDIELL